jgi:hypothetical protein
MAMLICGSYRRDEAHDPDVFAAALAVVLADYTRVVVDYACDPRVGVVSRFPMGLPNVGQVKEFLDWIQDRLYRNETYNERVRKQIEERDRYVADRGARPSYDDLKAKHGPSWGLAQEQKPVYPEPAPISLAGMTLSAEALATLKRGEDVS